MATIKSDLTQYDNSVQKTASSNGNFKGKLSGGINGFMQNLSDQVSSVISDKVNQLNQLAKSKLGGLLGSLGNLLNFQGSDFLKNALQGLLGKAMGALAGYINNSLKMLKALGTDTLRQLTNASLNYLANIAEDYINNLKSSFYIDDKIFLATIQSLYYGAGADLAYNNHYLRNQCLKRDWCETLKFVDSEYGVNYNTSYVRLRSDIKTCSLNSCHKNLFYIFSKIYEEIKNYEILIENSDKKIQYYKVYKGFEREKGYKSEVDINKKYKRDKETLEKLMVGGLKNLIVYSYTYTTTSDIRRFFSAYPDILKPKYYGTNDDKYKKEFLINSGDCGTMLPFFTKHNLSKSDIATMENISIQSEKLDNYNNELSDDAKFDEARAILSDSGSSAYDKGKAYAIIEREEARNRSLKTQSDRSSSMALTALTRGAKGVHEDSRARYPMQNDLKNRVKYRDRDIANLLDDTFNTKDQYTVPRNKNIKSIYILLSSKELYADYMVNEAFYLRCKYPTMTTLNAAADKAKGLLGASMMAQAMYDISDAIDGSAYRYTKKVEKFLLDPRKNFSDISNATQVTFDKDDLNSIELPEELHETLEQVLELSPSNTNKDISAENGVNVASINEMEKEADKDLAVKKDIADSVRYVQSLTMIKKKEMIVNYMVKFYNLCLKYGIDEKQLIKAYGKLTLYIFAKTVKSVSDLYGPLLDNATNESLSRNIQTIISIQKTKSIARIMGVENSRFKDTYIKLYDLVCNSLNLESSTAGFVQMTFNYDKEHLSSLFKQYYLKQLDYLKSINNKSNPKYKDFYTYKDSMTKTFEGFDRNGVFGYSEEKDRLRYTNIETGDWRAIHYSPKNGTFFTGSMNTKGNGIMKLNESLEELQSTNVTSGNWLKIVEFNDRVFFINEDDSIWYWNGSNVVKTNVEDYSKYEFDLFKSYDIIFLKGKNNNGIKVWKDNSFVTITDTGDGWVYDDIQNNDYYILYSSNMAGKSYFFDKTAKFIPTNLNDSIVSWFLTIPELSYTYEKEESDDEESSDDESSDDEEEDKKVTVTQHQCHFFISTKTKGVFDCIMAPSDSTSFEPSSVSPVKCSKFDSNKINILYKNTNDGKSCLCIDGSDIYKVMFLSSKEGDSQLPVVDQEKVITSKDKVEQLTNSEILSYKIINTICTKYGIIAEHEKTVSAGNKENELWYYDKTAYTDNRKKIANRTLKGISFFIGEDGVTTFGKTNDNYYIFADNELKQILTSQNDIKPGWILEYVNNTYFMVNHTNPLGIKIIRNNTAINTNIVNGYWNVTCSDTKLFALSIKNTNKGIRYTSKNNPTNFGEISKSPYNYQDVYGYSYNPIRKVMYFGSCRDELLLNIDVIQYNIDVYIYILTLYQLKQKLQNFAADGGNIGINSVLEKLEEKDGELSENDLIEINNMVDNLNSDLNSQISEQRETEKSSGLYTDLVTYAEAMREFDIDNNTAKESLLLSMINDFDYIPSFDERIPYFSIIHVEPIGGSNIKPDPNIQYYTKDENDVYTACPKPLLNFEPGVTYYTYILSGPNPNLQEKFLAKISYTSMMHTMNIDANTLGYIRLFDTNYKPDPNIQYYTRDANGIYNACPNPLPEFESGIVYYVNMHIGTHDWNKQFNKISDDFLNTDEDYIDYTIR